MNWTTTIRNWWSKYHPNLHAISIAIVTLVIGINIIESVVSPIGSIPLGVEVEPGFKFSTLIPVIVIIALIGLSLMYVRDAK